MILVSYSHRLPATHDLDALRRWLGERGAVWDDAPDLYFKAFLLREAGRFGALAHNFASLYLWRQETAFRDWLVRGGFKVVTDAIGRAAIETLVVLDASRGPARAPRFLYRADIALPMDADLTATFAAEIDLARERAREPDVVAAVTALDPERWVVSRILLSQAEPDARDRGPCYQVAHLSSPLLDTLPPAAEA